MPCYDSRNSPSEVRSAAREEFRHNSDVAEMLCDLLKRLDPSQVCELPVNTQKWWVEHQKRDTEKASRV